MNSESILKLAGEVEKMLPLYKDKKQASLKPFVANLEWNLRKLRGEKKLDRLSPEQWLAYTGADLGNIALCLAKGEAGQAFAADFDDKIAALTAPAPTPAIAATTPEPAPAPEIAATEPEPEPEFEPTDLDEPEPIAPADLTPPPAPFDVRAHLADKAGQSKEKLAWKTSVVDLMKLLGLDSSMGARKKTAALLGFSESEIASIGSEEGNELLRTQLVATLAANRGSLPFDPASIA